MTEKKPTILVTGGVGFLGKHLVRQAARDYEVVALTRRSEAKAREIIPDPAVSIISTTSSSLETLFSTYQFSAVVHCAVLYGKSEVQQEVNQTNVALPLELVRLGTKYGTGLFIHIDTFFSKLPHDYPYLKEYRDSKRKVVAELRNKEGVLRIANLQLEHLYGPDESADKFLPSLVRDLLAKKDHIDLTGGEQRRDLIFVDDVVSAILLLMNHRGELPAFSQFEVGTGESHTIREIVSILKDLTKSYTELRFGALPYRPHELMESKADIAALRALGWTPQVRLTEGLSKVVASY